jgi:hypothetical protein
MTTTLCPRVVGSTGQHLITCQQPLPCPQHGQPAVVIIRPATHGHNHREGEAPMPRP